MKEEWHDSKFNVFFDYDDILMYVRTCATDVGFVCCQADKGSASAEEELQRSRQPRELALPSGEWQRSDLNTDRQRCKIYHNSLPHFHPILEDSLAAAGYGCFFCRLQICYSQKIQPISPLPVDVLLNAYAEGRLFLKHIITGVMGAGVKRPPVSCRSDDKLSRRARHK